MSHTPTGARVFSGERPWMFSVAVNSATPQKIISHKEGERNIVQLRFVCTEPVPDPEEAENPYDSIIPQRPPIVIRPMPDPVGTTIPQLWICARNETPTDDTRFFPEDLKIYPGRGYVEPGTKDSPVAPIGYGQSVWVAALQGSFNLWVTLSADWK